jgi:hypothetical protein
MDKAYQSLIKASDDPLTAALVQNYLNKQNGSNFPKKPDLPKAESVPQRNDAVLPRLSNSLQSAGAMQM